MEVEVVPRLASLAAWQRRLLYVTGGLMTLALVAGFVYAEVPVRCDSVNEPAGCWSAPLSQKLFYFHVPIAWAAYASFTVLFVASLLQLIDSGPGTRFWSDVVSVASAEVGVVLTTLTLLSGMIWGEAEWGVAWRWNDTKLVMVFLLWLTYLGYLVLRAQVEAPDRRARLAAVYGMLGFVMVPLSWMAQRIWQSLHPEPILEGGLVTPSVRNAFFLSLLAFTFLASWLIIAAVRMEASKRAVEEIQVVFP